MSDECTYIFIIHHCFNQLLPTRIVRWPRIENRINRCQRQPTSYYAHQKLKLLGRCHI